MNRASIESGSNDRDTGDLAAIKPEVYDRVWKFVVEAGLQERHFNQLQTEYRKLASTWLLAAFGAIGLLLTNSSFALPIDTWNAICILVTISGYVSAQRDCEWERVMSGATGRG